MKEKGLRAPEMAVRIGVTEQAVRHYLRGERIPAPEVMRRIVAATGGAVTPNDFYDVSAGGDATAGEEMNAG